MIRPSIEFHLHNLVANSLPASKASRMDWMLARSNAFLDTMMLWHPQNLVPILLILLGLLALRRHSRTGHSCWLSVVVICVFVEMLVWSRTWITFSKQPDAFETETLYPTPDWADRLKNDLADEGLLWIHDGQLEFDFFQLNAQAGIAVAALEGYETIRPAMLIRPSNMACYDPILNAALGVSHVLIPPGTALPTDLTNWIERIDSPDLHLYRNPAFDSRWLALLSDESVIPLRDQASSPNRHEFDVPAGAVAISLAEPFHQNWADDFKNKETGCRAEKNEMGGTTIFFDRPPSRPCRLNRSFRPRNPFSKLQLALLGLLAVWNALTFLLERTRPRIADASRAA